VVVVGSCGAAGDGFVVAAGDGTGAPLGRGNRIRNRWRGRSFACGVRTNSGRSELWGQEMVSEFKGRA
jgi:hypothetical protein